METFATPRLSATKLACGDLADLVKLHLDEEVSRFLGGVRSPATTAAYLETNLIHWANHGFGLWTLRTEDGVFMGRAGLRVIEIEGVQELEVAYAFVRAAWGRGLATEVAKALVELWRAHRSERSLVGVVMKGNRSSEDVLKKAGLSYERDVIFHNETCGVFRRVR